VIQEITKCDPGVEIRHPSSPVGFGELERAVQDPRHIGLERLLVGVHLVGVEPIKSERLGDRRNRGPFLDPPDEVEIRTRRQSDIEAADRAEDVGPRHPGRRQPDAISLEQHHLAHVKSASRRLDYGTNPQQLVNEGVSGIDQTDLWSAQE